MDMFLSFFLALHSLCPQDSAARAAVDQGWRQYQADQAQAAFQSFAVADSLCPGIRGAATGGGFAALRLGKVEDAATLFQRATAADSLDADAFYGLGIALRRDGKRDLAIEAFGKALRIAPSREDAQSELLALGVSPPLPPARRPD